MKHLCGIYSGKTNLQLLLGLSALILGTLFSSACGNNKLTQPQLTVVIQDYIQAADVLGIVVDENMKVLEVEAGNAAEKAGIQVDDVIEAIDDIPFITPDGNLVEASSKAQNLALAKQKIWEVKEGKKIKLKIKRKDKNIEIEVIPSPPVPRADNAPTPTPVFAPMDYF